MLVSTLETNSKKRQQLEKLILSQFFTWTLLKRAIESFPNKTKGKTEYFERVYFSIFQ